MGKIIKNKILGLILPLMMVLTIFIPSVKASEVESYTIRLLLNTEKLEVENKDDYYIKPSKRQVIYYKLKDGVELGEDKIINIVNDIYDKNQKDTEAYLKESKLWDSEGILSPESKFDAETEPDGTIPGKDFKLSQGNEDGIKEVIEITGLKAGIYLIKESDDSIKKHSNKKITPKIIKVPGEDKTKPVIEILNKVKKENPKTTVTLEKVDGKDKNIKLAGAEFYLYRVTGEKKEGILIDENTAKIGKYNFSKYGDDKAASVLKTDENGKIEVGNLEKLPENSFYEFVEKTPPLGYDAVIDVKKKAELGKTVQVENNKTPILKKINSDDKSPLEGVVFNLYRSKDNKLIKFKKIDSGYIEDEKGEANLITDKDGLLRILKVEDGEYYFKETKTKDGFEILTEKTKNIKIKNSKALNEKGDPIILVVKNKPKTPPTTNKPKTPTGGYKFIKTDDSSEAKRLSGARFKVLTKVNGTLTELGTDRKPLTDKSKSIYMVTSDKDGNISVDGLPYEEGGTKYYLTEVHAPDGYIPYNGLIEFTVNAASMDNKPTQIKNKKKPPEPGTPPPTPEKPPVPPTPEKPNTVIKTEKPNTIIKTDKPINTVKTDYTPSTQTTVSKIIRGPLVKTGDIRIIIMAVIGLILLIVGVKLVRSAEKPRIA